MAARASFTLVLMSAITSCVLAGHLELLESLPPEIQSLYSSGLGNWTPPEHLQKNYPYYLSGFDEDEHPIWILEFGRWDLRVIVEQGKDAMVEFEKYINLFILNIYNSTITKEEVLPLILIIDLDGYDLHQITSPPTLGYVVQNLRRVVVALKNLHAAYCINNVHPQIASQLKRGKVGGYKL